MRLSPTRGIDCVVANAGINLAEESSTFEQPPDYHHPLVTAANGQKLAIPPPPKFKTIDVNLTGVLYTSHLAHAYLPLNPGSTACTPMPTAHPQPQSNRDRHLLLIASLAGFTPLPTQSLYSTTSRISASAAPLRITLPTVGRIGVEMK